MSGGVSAFRVRAAYLCEYPSVLGGERSLIEFLSHARPWVEPVVTAPAQGDLADVLHRHQIPRVCWPDSRKSNLDALAGELADFNVQLVHANSLSTASAAWELGRLLRLPAIAHVRDIRRISGTLVARLSQLDAVVAVSLAVRRSLVEQGVSKAVVRRVYNGVDITPDASQSARSTLRRRLNLSTDSTLIGCVGQIALRKGQDTFLDAAALVAREIPSAQFLMVGCRFGDKAETRDFERKLHAAASSPSLAGRVHWLGYVADWPSLVSGLDLLVAVSRQEPLSRAVLEAVAAGVPVVASDVGGMREILRSPVLGDLVKVDHPQTTASAMLSRLATQHKHFPMARVARRRFACRFAIERQVQKMVDLYRSVLGGGADAPILRTTGRGIETPE